MKGAGIILLTLGGMLLAGILLPLLNAPRSDAKKAITRHEMSVIQTALSFHVQEYGNLPEESVSTSVLDILCGKNTRKISFYSATPDRVRDHQLLDAWDRPFVFRKIGDNMLIRSSGKDGIYYTHDDLTLEALASKPANAASQGH